MINIYLGTINRSGGSLLARLFDGHEDVASYPVEVSFPNNNQIAPDLESVTGIPRHIPNYNTSDVYDYYQLANISPSRIHPVHKWGKESGDHIGVRKNYLEKEFYGKVKTDFNYEKFISLFDDYCKEVVTYKDIINAKHKAYFTAWDNNSYAGKMKFVVWHDSAGFYISNHSKYFDEFDDSFWIYPVRSVYGYIGSEKTRLARRYFGSRRFPKIKFPNTFVKRFNNYDIDAHINSWLAAYTRVVLFQEKYKINERFLVYSYENLVNNTEDVMKAICKKINLNYAETLLEPTLARNPWGGSSHQGKQFGVNSLLADYYKEVLTEEEIMQINKTCLPLVKLLNENTSPLLDLTKTSKEYLYDYDYQKKYFNDEEKTAMYSFIMNCNRRRDKIKPPNKISIIAYIFSKIIPIIHIPRLIKLRFLPGLGNQNYT